MKTKITNETSCVLLSLPQLTACPYKCDADSLEVVRKCKWDYIHKEFIMKIHNIKYTVSTLKYNIGFDCDIIK